MFKVYFMGFYNNSQLKSKNVKVRQQPSHNVTK